MLDTRLSYSTYAMKGRGKHNGVCVGNGYDNGALRCFSIGGKALVQSDVALAFRRIASSTPLVNTACSLVTTNRQ
jgi:hypothetical protein